MIDVFAQFKSRYVVFDYLWISFLVGILLVAVRMFTGLTLKPGNPLWVLSLSSLIMVMLCVATINRLRGHHFQLKYLLGSQPIHKLPWLLLLIVFYGFQTLMTGVSQLTFFFSHSVAPEWTESAIKSANTQFSLDTDSLPLKILFLGALFLFIVIVAPITEEFLFRGVLLHRFAEKWDIATSVVVCSILFGIVHFNIYSIAIAVSFIFVALIYLQTRSLIASIFIHAMNNAIVWVNILINVFLQAEPQTTVTIHTLWAGLFNTAMAIPILVYFLKWPSHFNLLPYAANSYSQGTENS